MTTSSPTRPRGRLVRRLVTTGVAAAVALVVSASPAGADTAQASATALLLASTPIPGTATASNDGTQPTVTSGTDASPVLPSNPALGAGAAAQVAVANADGTSAACAGLVAPSSEITIAPNGACDPGTAESGVTLNLGGTLVLSAGAIVAQCTASSTGEPTASTILADARVTLAGLPLLTLDADPDPNDVVGLNGILDVRLNTQTVNPDGSVTVSALSVDLLGGGLLEVGRVTCGPNVVTGAIPLVPAEGLPLAAGVLVATAGVGALVITRRQRERHAAA